MKLLVVLNNFTIKEKICDNFDLLFHSFISQVLIYSTKGSFFTFNKNIR